MKSLDEMSDYLNPLLVKEIRQLFHSKQYLVLISLFLLGELAVLYIMMLNYKDMGSYTKESLGTTAFVFQCIGMSLAVFLLCMFRTCQMFNKERMDKNLDYTRLCSITPFTVACGKVLSATAMMLVIIALIAPFMVISYFLRSISLQTIMLWMLILVPLYMLGIQLSVLFGSIGKKGAEGILFLALVIVAPNIIGTLAAMLFSRRHSAPKIEEVAFLLASISVGLFLQAFSWTVALISRSKSNIMFHPRICALAICILYPLLCGCAVFLFPSSMVAAWCRSGDAVMLTEIIMSLVTGTIQFAFIFERDTPGVRVMAERPKSRLLRAGMFFLSSGKAGGISLCAVLQVLGFVVYQAARMKVSGSHSFDSPLSVSLYMMFYCLFAVMLNRIFPKINTIVCFVISLSIWLALPVIAGYSYATLASMSDSAVYEILFTTPLFVFADSAKKTTFLVYYSYRLLVPLVPCILLLAVLSRYIVREFIHFVKDEEEAA